MNAQEILRVIDEEILTSPERWTTDAMARDVDNGVIDVMSPRATCWCLIGAMRKAVNWEVWNHEYGLAAALLNNAIKVIAGREMERHHFNDEMGYDKVKEAIALARSQA